MTAIKNLIDNFIAKATAIIEREVRGKVLAALTAGGVSAKPARSARRKGPIQLCPVPGCKERAAPVFGMLCSKHKDTPKVKVKLYRERRRKRAANAKK